MIEDGQSFAEESRGFGVEKLSIQKSKDVMSDPSSFGR